jgi:hypothetical protein
MISPCSLCPLWLFIHMKTAVSKRFVKKQQMSWSRRGAHLLLQVRTRVLNEEFREKFDEWYPGFNAQSEDQARAT